MHLSTLFAPLALLALISASPIDVESVEESSEVEERTTCVDPKGLAWAYYRDILPLDLPTDPNYLAFRPGLFKKTKPSFTSVTGKVGGFSYSALQLLPVSIYNSPKTLGPINFVLNHRGFIKAPKAGAYHITTEGTDDAVYVWIGKNAYTGYSQKNAVFSSAAYAEQKALIFPGSKSQTVHLVKGYNPIRIIYGQALGGAKLDLTIRDTQGKIVIGPNFVSNNVVQKSCANRVRAFPAFGNEL